MTRRGERFADCWGSLLFNAGASVVILVAMVPVVVLLVVVVLFVLMVLVVEVGSTVWRRGEGCGLAVRISRRLRQTSCTSPRELR